MTLALCGLILSLLLFLDKIDLEAEGERNDTFVFFLKLYPSILASNYFSRLFQLADPKGDYIRDFDA